MIPSRGVASVYETQTKKRRKNGGVVLQNNEMRTGEGNLGCSRAMDDAKMRVCVVPDAAATSVLGHLWRDGGHSGPGLSRRGTPVSDL